MKLPTKAQWDEIAKLFEDRNSSIPITAGGICHALDSMGFRRGWAEYYDFLKPFAPPLALNNRKYGYWWEKYDAGDRERAFFCMLMGAITEAGDMDDMIEEV